MFRCTSRLLRESESFLLRLKYINIRQHRTQAPTNIPTPIPIAIHAPELKLTFDGVVKVDVDSASPAFPVEATLAVVFVVASTLATKFQPLTGTAETVCLVKYDVVTVVYMIVWNRSSKTYVKICFASIVDQH